jgi:aldehyde dehydrogenase (NAD+)
MGSPISLGRNAQAPIVLGHLSNMIDALKHVELESVRGSALILKEPIGVCALITPWNWPLHQIACKVLPALAAGCTMVLKPSELSPISAHIFAEVLNRAGVPKGVFNLIDGEGPIVGEALARHPDVDMVSFTGSTRAGIQVAKAAADTVKRVTQELGGKSANVLLRDCDFDQAVAQGVQGILLNSGQSCNAPSRMFVPVEQYDRVAALARTEIARAQVGAPTNEATTMGPQVSKAQYDRVQGYIQSGLDEGATLIAGGLGRPSELNQGYYVRPTIFGRVRPDMRIAREEIFGPVLSILTYETEEQAIAAANDTVTGLAAYVSSSDPSHAHKVAGQLRAGNVYVNGASFDLTVPFGGYKQSGNGREFGEFGLDEYFEFKAVLGYAAAKA